MMLRSQEGSLLRCRNCRSQKPLDDRRVPWGLVLRGTGLARKAGQRNGTSRNGIHFCKRPAASRRNAPSQKSIIVSMLGSPVVNAVCIEEAPMTTLETDGFKVLAAWSHQDAIVLRRSRDLARFAKLDTASNQGKGIVSRAKSMTADERKAARKRWQNR
jgi:hypothetical protein